MKKKKNCQRSFSKPVGSIFGWFTDSTRDGENDEWVLLKTNLDNAELLKEKKVKVRMVTASEIAAKLNLKPHPEGGFYAETFRDPSIILSKSQLPPQCKSFTQFKSYLSTFTFVFFWHG